MGESGKDSPVFCLMVGDGPVGELFQLRLLMPVSHSACQDVELGACRKNECILI